MDDCFEDEEKLYRAVIPKDMYIKKDGSLTSAAFKATDGCSVDRGNYRNDNDAVSFMRKTLEGSVYSILVKTCRERDIYIKYEPTDGNPFHSGLYKDLSLSKMTPGQCKYLAQSAVFVG